jgi:ArsR family transcriptional regulator
VICLQSSDLFQVFFFKNNYFPWRVEIYTRWLYNTFQIMNIKSQPEDRLALLFSQLRQPARNQILLIIGPGETCVCHIEAILGLRQATISQHLMALRKSGWLSTRRDGRHIYYRLAEIGLLDLLHRAGELVGIDAEELDRYSLKPYPGCTCPQCYAEPGKRPAC